MWWTTKHVWWRGRVSLRPLSTRKARDDGLNSLEQKLRNPNIGTLRISNMAIGHPPFIDYVCIYIYMHVYIYIYTYHFPVKASIYQGFSIAIIDYQRVNEQILIDFRGLPCLDVADIAISFMLGVWYWHLVSGFTGMQLPSLFGKGSMSKSRSMIEIINLHSTT